MMLNLINLNNNFKKINTGKRKEVYCLDSCTGSKEYKYCDVSNGIVSKIKY